jgi:hypothetical protein
MGKDEPEPQVAVPTTIRRFLTKFVAPGRWGDELALKRPDSAMVRIPATISNTGADGAEAILSAPAPPGPGGTRRRVDANAMRGNLVRSKQEGVW